MCWLGFEVVFVYIYVVETKNVSTCSDIYFSLNEMRVEFSAHLKRRQREYTRLSSIDYVIHM